MRVGWVVHRTLDGGPRRFRKVPPPASMRVVNVAKWINGNSRDLHNEMYRPSRRYDLVVFFKTMDERSQEEAHRIQAYGGRVVFDANVNYYEIAGTYPIEETRPTERQREQAIAMSTLADWVVADSTYLLGVVTRFNECSSWIPDNIDLSRFGRQRRHRGEERLRLVWSGMSSKAASLLEIRDVLEGLGGLELVVVSEARPPSLDCLAEAVPCRYVPFTERRYARILRNMDVIISPRALTNPYDLSHTEYKITLGMAAGLPAVASPQQAYVEAIEYAGGGIVARDAADWEEALLRLRDPEVRADLGRRARRTVEERYSTPVVAAQFAELFLSLG